MTDEDVLCSANEHNGRYVLRRTDDEAHRICQQLVDSGSAEWVSWFSSYYPAIRLTSKGEHMAAELAR